MSASTRFSETITGMVPLTAVLLPPDAPMLTTTA